MSGPVYETLYQFSRTLTDDHIDEDLSEVETANDRTVQCQVVHARGKLDGRPVVVSYHSHYFLGARGYRYIPNVLEVFVTGNHLKFEGECRARGFADKLARWFGGGGRRGPDPIFDACRIDAPRDADLADFSRPDFTARLAALSGHVHCLQVQVQAGTGINALFHGTHYRSSLPRLQAIVHDVAALAAA